MAVGVDVSNWNNVTDWKRVAGAGVKVCYVEATEGVTWNSPTMAEQIVGAHAAGLQVGAYHFFLPSDDGAAQAQHFLAAVGTYRQYLDLPHVVDCESRQGETNQVYIQKLLAYLRAVRQPGDKVPTIYFSPAFWEVLGDVPDDFKAYGVWLAEYGVSAPRLPKTWSAFLGWQYTSVGALPGIQGNVDMTRWDAYGA